MIKKIVLMSILLSQFIAASDAKSFEEELKENCVNGLLAVRNRPMSERVAHLIDLKDSYAARVTNLSEGYDDTSITALVGICTQQERRALLQGVRDASAQEKSSRLDSWTKLLEASLQKGQDSSLEGIDLFDYSDTAITKRVEFLDKDFPYAILTGAAVIRSIFCGRHEAYNFVRGIRSQVRKLKENWQNVAKNRRNAEANLGGASSELEKYNERIRLLDLDIDSLGRWQRVVSESWK